MSVLLAALLAGQAPAAVPIELDGYLRRAEQLDGHWVEFDAYVYWIRTRTRRPVLSALTGEEITLRSGRHVTACADNNEATLAVIMQGAGLGRLGRRAARPRDAYVGVRVRGIFHNRPYSYRLGGVDAEWGAVVNHARIVRVTGTRCLVNPRVAEEAAAARH
jgi:hypothetical protein